MKSASLLPFLRPSSLRLIALLAVSTGSLLTPGPALRAAELRSEATVGDYRIAPRDQLQFQVFDEEASLLVQRVSSAGEISVPLLGAVKVAGLTLRESESLMEKRYREGGFYLKPQVILSFQAYAPRSISVLGQVNNPNQIDFAVERGTIGIVTAITRAGGFTRVARTDAVRVMRTVDGRETSFTINVASYLDDKTKDQEFRLLPDDIVFVPERVF
ncbi:polysaccharide biosynthesis/export family protein [Horticoccus sp. 23ND18S-11]|uniref:polysaccharide biosynthesis/export family protein n=1 Tax=Horticoccus sp. 23ND18S-11 TaxID=3391832 RepID=UPI0039C977CB